MSRPSQLTDAHLDCLDQADIPRVLRYFELSRDLYALARELRFTAFEIERWSAQPEIAMCLSIQPDAPTPHSPPPHALMPNALMPAPVSQPNHPTAPAPA
ncbi:MAG: hypothetical protein ACK46I_00725, partial [Phycisphaerae bacterium]